MKFLLCVLLGTVLLSGCGKEEEKITAEDLACFLGIGSCDLEMPEDGQVYTLILWEQKGSSRKQIFTADVCGKAQMLYRFSGGKLNLLIKGDNSRMSCSFPVTDKNYLNCIFLTEKNIKPDRFFFVYAEDGVLYGNPEKLAGNETGFLYTLSEKSPVP